MSSAVGGVDNNVSLKIKDSLDYKSGYVNNVESIKSINYSINANESRIKNAKTLYDLNKAKYKNTDRNMESFRSLQVGTDTDHFESFYAIITSLAFQHDEQIFTQSITSQ